MKRRSFRKPAITLSLFPFLAVLVCTVGALIVLLVTVLQKARTDAAATAEQTAADLQTGEEQFAELRLERDDHQWKRSELERQRSEFQQKLAQERLTLSHFEEHIRRLEEQWKRLKVQAGELHRLGTQETDDAEATQLRLAQLQAEMAEKREQLENARRQAKGRERAFAIIPYDGPNATRRRPIYIECTDQGIVLQPEGIVLAPTDFEGSLGPGNPLDAALRTTREYLVNYSASTARGEPYPLLIVRPSGAVAYAVARSAMKSWDDEFGYELVDADMQLAFPKPDPTLKTELERAIADARQRQAILASMMPGRFKAAGKMGLVATTSSGFNPVSGSPTATRSASWSSENTRNGVPGSDSGFSEAFRDKVGDGQYRSLTMPGARPAAGSQAASSQAAGSQAAAAKAPRDGYPTRSGSRDAAGMAAAPGGTPGQTGGTWQPGMPSSTNHDPDSGNSPSLTGGKPAGLARKAPPGMKSLAQERGANWGLPNQGSRATGIQRFMQVQVLADRLVLLPDRGDYRSPTVIPMPAGTTSAVDPFVAAVWKRIEQWGIAGNACFWKPVLRVEVSPDAESRFAELTTLLDGSGLVVERK